MASTSNMSGVARREVTKEVTEFPRNLNEDFTRGTNLNDGFSKGIEREGFRQDLGRGGCTCLGPCKCGLGSGLRQDGLKEEVYRREFGREGSFVRWCLSCKTLLSPLSKKAKDGKRAPVRKSWRAKAPANASVSAPVAKAQRSRSSAQNNANALDLAPA
jgi:hypothetical protein